MKRDNRYITIPTSFWENIDLSLTAKVVLIEIDSYPRSELGVNVRSGAVATALGITKKECDNALKELFDKGAIQVNISEGQKLLLPLIYKERYIPTGQPIPEGEKPSPTNSIDYDDVQAKWAEICPMLPPIQRFTPQRKRKVKAALNQAQLTVADLYKCFRIIASVAFLNGSSDQFKADFDWLVKKSENTDKVFRGYYSRSAQEKQDYEHIMKGKETTTKTPAVDDFYR